MTNTQTSDAFSIWANERRRLGHDMIAVKGPAPKGATYSDGTPITRSVNVAWVDCETGERFDVVWGTP